MSHILLIGASSGIGLETLKLGLKAGHEIRAFSRRADKIKIINSNLEKIKGDALIEDNINKAINDVDVVIQALGIPLNIKLLTGPITLFSKATEILLSAMKKTGVKRIISVTGFGAGDSYASISPLQKIGFELIFGRAYHDKSKQEKMIKQSDRDWVIVRPGVLTNARANKNYKVLINPNEWRNGIISRRNVAEFLIQQVSEDKFLKKSPVLIG